MEKDEISDIVAKRRSFEMSLAQGRGTKPTDYLRYIEYERRLEKLRKARAARIPKTAKKSLSDHSILAHITQLHRLSVRRFPESLELWDAFIAHSLSQASPLLVSRTLTSAIAMHPTETRYWIMASQWESDGDRKGMGGGNTEGARRLCMRALRFLKGRNNAQADQEAVWREWIRVEVAFVERLRERWHVLGIGKGKNGGEEIVRVADKGKQPSGSEEEEGAEEHDDEVEEEIALPGDEVDDSQLKQEVDQKALSGQEALLDGAIVRVVLDNLLKASSHSIESYNFVLSVLRPLASPLRLALRAHVYASLRANILPSTPSYPAAVHILATRHLYDVAYVPPKKKNSKKRTADEMGAGAAGPEQDPFAIQVEGEKLVDAIGKACEEYWTVLKKLKADKKGKGKERDQASTSPQAQQLWERFSGWLEEMAEQTDEEDLLEYLSANLESALSSAPSSAFLSLVKLRNLLHTGAATPSVRNHLDRMIKQYGTDRTPPAQREQVWVANLETVSSSLGEAGVDDDALEKAFVQATRTLPYSSKVWDLYADFAERQSGRSPADVEAWYEKSIRRSLLTDALPPAGFDSTFVSYAHVTPRELLPRRFVHYLATTSPSDFQPKVVHLLASAPTLSLSFLSSILDPSGPALETISSSSNNSSRTFRRKIHERIVAHPDAGVEEWLAYAEELVRAGEASKSQEVVQRARGQLLAGSGGEGAVRQFDAGWAHVCSTME
ncbi:U3 snoRNP protein [Rhodotorula mucilaginosa]|uniref:U3 snoRNP protein n=1 Tax=Rhodotorula mucilaginosa TaxID=5537 RepID=A0A9P6VSH4_RHOMI|nr:U3 snoRNP protein [Rhodotorula mucilaginosa]TKA56658.1 hypothetical protein B0A53_01853 [Rhodotorula sp. CCFEE 5036]